MRFSDCWLPSLWLLLCFSLVVGYQVNCWWLPNKALLLRFLMLVVKLSDAFWLFHVSGWQDECCLVASLVIGCRINSCFCVSLLLLVAKTLLAAE